MSRETAPFHEGSPYQTIKWNDSKAEIYSVGDDERVWIYDRADFSAPIERARIHSEMVNLESGEKGRAFYAEIQLSESQVQDAMSSLIGGVRPIHRFGGRNDLLGQSSDFVPYNGKDGDLSIGVTRFSNLISIAHERGQKVLVWVDEATNKVTVTNNIRLTGPRREGQEAPVVSVSPRPQGTIDEKDELDGFFKAFMRTMDYASGTLHHSPKTARLKRTYPIGNQFKRFVAPSATTRGVGSAATKGSERSASTDTGESKRNDLGLDQIQVETKITLDDVGGLESVKATLRDIAVSFQHADIMEKWGAKRPQGVLLYGPAGTGKTMLSEALANELEAKLWAIQSTDIYEKWLGNSEERVKAIFTKARASTERLILFFDEFDSIVGITEGPSPGGADNARNAVAGIFKQEMNTLAQENPNVLVVAATNDLERIDPALVRSGRFDYRVYVPMPDEPARADIIAARVAQLVNGQAGKEFEVIAGDIIVPELAAQADTMSGADINEVFRRLSLQKAMQEARTGLQSDPINHAELLRAIRTFRTT